IHFMYPVMTTLLMIAFYHEARKASTLSAVLLAVIGVGVLSWQSDGNTSIHGVAIELISACCYALYLIRVNRSRVRNMDGMKLTFYVMGIGALIFGAEALRQGDFQPVTTSLQVTNLLVLGIVCTVITNLCLVAAVKSIGSTMTAVLGALEPLTAVALGCLLMGEAITANIIVGICLIIPSVVIIIFTRARRPAEAEE
ncbi:MAG: DMT family transporter, partial [Alloprevotella sp.]